MAAASLLAFSSPERTSLVGQEPTRKRALGTRVQPLQVDTSKSPHRWRGKDRRERAPGRTLPHKLWMKQVGLQARLCFSQFIQHCFIDVSTSYLHARSYIPSVAVMRKKESNTNRARGDEQKVI